jgi:Kinetochore Sim4 complex subunit FTA2
MDPFHAECRAFGHLQDQGRNGDLAVRCYGYTFIEEERGKFLSEKFGVKDWNRSPDRTNKPFRAIVKQLISDETSFTAKMIPRMKRNLRELHRLGIYVMDIRPENYRQGILFDFSVAWTRPHIMLSTVARYLSEIQKDMDEDEIYFDKLVDEENAKNVVKIWDRMRRSIRYVGKLRPLPHRRRHGNFSSSSGTSDDSSSTSESSTVSLELASSRGRTKGVGQARKGKASDRGRYQSEAPKRTPNAIKRKPVQRGRKRK